MKRRESLAPEQRYAAAIVGILLLILVLVLTLTWQAWRAGRGQRAIGDAALVDQAATAAGMYRARINAVFYTALTNAFLPLATQEGVRPPAPDTVMTVIDSLQRCQCAFVVPAPFVFRVDLATGDLAVAGRETPAVEQQRWIAGQVMTHVAKHDEPGTRFTSFVSGFQGALRLLIYSVVRSPNGDARWAVGFELDSATLAREVFAPRFESGPLFTNARLESLPRDSVAAVRVLAPSGQILYQSATHFPDLYVGRTQIEAFMGHLTFAVTLNPATARSVLAIGAERMDARMLGMVLVLAAALLALAVVLLWRTISLARLRADFTASVSHELRTPLAQIMLFAETMAHGRLATIADYRRESNVILQEGRRLLHLVENVLHFARAGRPGIPLRLRPVLLGPLVNDTIQSFATLAAESDLVIRAEIDDGIGADVDAAAVRRALTNLLENAMKYGGSGPQIVVGLSLDDEWAQIRVDDRGPGVPRRDRERVWRPFTRLEREIDGATAGSGIGLAIVRDIVHHHRGRAWVEDSPLGGARFVLAFPGAWRVERGERLTPAGREAAAVFRDGWIG